MFLLSCTEKQCNYCSVIWMSGCQFLKCLMICRATWDNYSNNPDQGSNRNGRVMVSLCKSCNLVPVNHIQTAKCKSNNGLSFKMKEKWVSQLDWIFPSKGMFKYIEACHNVEDANLPTNHARVCHLELSEYKIPMMRVLERARELLRSIQLWKVNETVFRERRLPPARIMVSDNDVDAVCSGLADQFYDSALSSMLRQKDRAKETERRANEGRWEWLMRVGDPKRLWKATDIMEWRVLKLEKQENYSYQWRI